MLSEANAVYSTAEQIQLTAEKRGKIEAYLAINCSISEIARMMNRSKSTISEEIKRGKHNGRYTASTARNKSKERRLKKKRSQASKTKLITGR